MDPLPSENHIDGIRASASRKAKWHAFRVVRFACDSKETAVSTFLVQAFGASFVDGLICSPRRGDLELGRALRREERRGKQAEGKKKARGYREFWTASLSPTDETPVLRS